MYDLAVFQKPERDENLNSEAVDGFDVESVVAVALNQFVQIFAQELEGDTLS